MTRANIEEQCRKISPDAYSEKSVCAFAPGEGMIGFIDTSDTRDGSRGIAFFGNRMCVNTDGEPRDVAYGKIINTHIISSFEDSFADELSVAARGMGELRISDYSLDKFELKKLLDRLCGDSTRSENPQNSDALRLENAARERDKTAGEQPVIEEYVPVIVDDPPVIGETAADITDEKIEWLNGPSKEDGAEKTAEAPKEEMPPAPPAQPAKPELPEVINGVIDRIPMIGDRKPPSVVKPVDTEKPEDKKVEEQAAPVPEKPVEEQAAPTDGDEGEIVQILTESELREHIESMSTDEMMKFLSETLKEINGEVEEQTAPAEGETTESESGSKWKKLTVEPIWGDIYIKASSSLRQLCESGKLTMEQMEDELRVRLLSAAEAFEQLTGDDSRVPKVMIPKITELKLAADNFDSYFSYGEDIAIRAMFFMLYQMLTYADRIAESPETKDRLNDFFRRFGSAGITLSMLDMRV